MTIHLPCLRLWRSSIRKFIAIAIATLCLCALPGCIPTSPPPPLRVAVNLWPGNETFALARSLGYYNKTPIRLVDYPSGTEEVRAYRNRDVEAAAISLERALAIAANEPDLRIILVVDISHGGDGIVSKPEIRNFSDLKGKRIGVESTALGAFVLSRALEKNTMTVTDLQIVSLQISEHERAFTENRIDAAVTYQPILFKLLDQGGNLLFDSREMPGEIVDVLVTHEQMLRDRSKALQILIDSYFRALNYLQQHPQDAARRVAPRSNVMPQQFLNFLKGMRQPDLIENQRLLGQQHSSLLEGARQLGRLMVTHNLIERSPEPAPLFEVKLVRKALKNQRFRQRRQKLRPTWQLRHNTN